MWLFFTCHVLKNVRASSANSNLIKINTNIIFTTVLNEFYVHCDFSKWLNDFLKNANEFYLNSLLLLIFSFHIRGPATVQNQIKFFDRLACISTVM